jgi:hypothetical protein
MINLAKRLRRYLRRQKLKLEDIHAGVLLNSILSQGKYFPTTGSSINLHSIATVVNDVIINRRQSIVEFGAGLSTLCFARVARDFDLNISIVSVDDNEAWLELMKQRLREENLEDRVTFVLAPLTDCPQAKDGLQWYDQQAILQIIQSVPAVDVLLVDGPMAYDRARELSRYPAVPFIKPYLSDCYSIFLDDLHRNGEQQIARWWELELDAKITKVNSQFWLLGNGDSFNPVV